MLDEVILLVVWLFFKKQELILVQTIMQLHVFFVVSLSLPHLVTIDYSYYYSIKVYSLQVYVF